MSNFYHDQRHFPSDTNLQFYMDPKIPPPPIPQNKTNRPNWENHQHHNVPLAATAKSYPECLGLYSLARPGCDNCRRWCSVCSEVARVEESSYRVPCTNPGCDVLRSIGSIYYHESVCVYNTTRCPQAYETSCRWLGTYGELQAHCLAEHQDLSLERKVTLLNFATTVTSKPREMQLSMIFIRRDIFRFAMMYTKEDDTVRLSCSYYGVDGNLSAGLSKCYNFSVKIDGIHERFHGKCSPVSESLDMFQCRYAIKLSGNTLKPYCNQYGDLIVYLQVRTKEDV